MAKARTRLDALLVERGLYESRSRAAAAVIAGEVRLAGGGALPKPGQLVAPEAGVEVAEPPRFVSRGGVKLANALDALGLDPAGRRCLDVGASTGGFTTVLLERGAARVYAVDAGHGQLLGSLRLDPRVVNLEATNVGDLTRELAPKPIDLVTIDVSYLSLASAIAQLDPLDFAVGAELVGLVKPMFELGLATAPADEASVERAIAQASTGLHEWLIVATMVSPVAGARGAAEGFIHARRNA